MSVIYGKYQKINCVGQHPAPRSDLFEVPDALLFKTYVFLKVTTLHRLVTKILTIATYNSRFPWAPTSVYFPRTQVYFWFFTHVYFLTVYNFFQHWCTYTGVQYVSTPLQNTLVSFTHITPVFNRKNSLVNFVTVFVIVIHWCYSLVYNMFKHR